MRKALSRAYVGEHARAQPTAQATAKALSWLFLYLVRAKHLRMPNRWILKRLSLGSTYAGLTGGMVMVSCANTRCAHRVELPALLCNCWRIREQTDIEVREAAI